MVVQSLCAWDCALMAPVWFHSAIDDCFCCSYYFLLLLAMSLWITFTLTVPVRADLGRDVLLVDVNVHLNGIISTLFNRVLKEVGRWERQKEIPNSSVGMWIRFYYSYNSYNSLWLSSQMFILYLWCTNLTNEACAIIVTQSCVAKTSGSSINLRHLNIIEPTGSSTRNKYAALLPENTK